MSNPKLLRFSDAVSLVLGFIPAYFDVIVTLVKDTASEWWDAISHFQLLDALFIVSNATLTLPFTPIIAIVRDLSNVLVRNADHYRRYIITGDEAVRLLTRNIEASFIEAGNLRNDSIIEAMLQRFALIVFNFLTKSSAFQKLLKLIAVRSAEDLYKVFRASAIKSVIMLLIRFFMIWFALGYAMISLIVVGRKFDELFEPRSQFSARVRFPKNKPRHRERIL